MHALMFEQFGDADVLRWGIVDDPVPGPDDALVRIDAAGLNFADIYRRRGRWRPAGDPPWILGFEGARTIAALGDRAQAAGWRIGDRVGFADSPHANAEYAVVPSEKLIALPGSIGTDIAAAVLLQGLTAHYLSHDSHPIRPGEWVVVHAAAGGVGLLLTQIARHCGARVIGIASSEAKRAAVSAMDADHVLDPEDWVEAARAITGGGAHAVYDSIGSSLDDSLRALRPRGRAVFYGMAGGDPPMVDPRVLMDRSLSLAGGDLWTMIGSSEKRCRRAAALFDWIDAGIVTPTIAARVPLQQGAEAHRRLESRTVIGKLVLTAREPDQ